MLSFILSVLSCVVFCFVLDVRYVVEMGYVDWWRRWRVWAGLGDSEAIGACLGAQVQVTQPCHTENCHFLPLDFSLVTIMYSSIPIHCIF
jgi:hypothetical protein